MLASLLLVPLFAAAALAQCDPTVTTASGSFAPAVICKGDLIFSDDFDSFDLKKWQHEITMSGGGNWEFQVYRNNRSNSFTNNGNLNIRPLLTAGEYGEAFLSSGTISLWGGAPADECTNPSYFGCERTGSASNVLNPALSARLRTVESFSFKYGKVEIRAKMPAGDWLWPALWMMPRNNVYGTWPASGEIDIMESRGNLNLVQGGVNIGTEQVGSTLHFGPNWSLNGWQKAHFSRNTAAGAGYDKDFHLFQLEWTPDYLRFSVDNVELGTITPPAGGFWELGDFGAQAPWAESPWRYAGKMAPFDQEFYLILNLAVGGVNGYFPDDASNPSPKPWSNTSPTASTDFWNGRNNWIPTWRLNENNGESASMMVDYVRVWAL